MTRARTALRMTLVSVMLVVSLPAQSEVIEEIVAKVNDDIITKTQIEGEERALIAEIYRRYTGPDLDYQVQMARKHLLQQMIDAKILVHRAERLYDMDVVKGVLLENFMNDQGIKSEEELQRMLAQQGATLEQLQQRLVAMFVPEEVIRFEVVGRESVGEREVEAYYHEHIKDYEIPAEVTLREIVLVAENEAEKTRRRAEAEEIRVRAAGPDQQFAEIATEVSEAPSAGNGGLIGPLHKGDLAGALDEIAFSLPVGEVSEIIETERTYHIITVVTRRQADFTPFEDVEEELRAMLEEMRYDEAYEDFMIKARAEAEIVVAPKYAEKYDWADPVLLQK